MPSSLLKGFTLVANPLTLYPVSLSLCISEVLATLPSLHVRFWGSDEARLGVEAARVGSGASIFVSRPWTRVCAWFLRASACSLVSGTNWYLS